MSPTVKITFTGDISLNDAYLDLWRKGAHPFSEVREIIDSSDLLVGNLECMAKGDKGENLMKQPRLTTDVATLGFLKEMRLGLACLANNHVYDHLEDGFEKTTAFLDTESIPYIGASSKGTAHQPFVFSRNGLSVGILNYVTHDTHPSLPEDSPLRLNYFDLEKSLTEISNLKKLLQYVVVSLHWGGRVEGSMFPEPQQRKIAEQLINSGADVIVGHHSHTLQPFEMYRGKPIFYSLGNFCFADVNFNGKLRELDRKRTSTSLLLHLHFSETGIEYHYTGIQNKQGYIQVVEKQNFRWRQLRGFEFRYLPLFWKLHSFKEKKIYPIYAYFFSNGRNPIRQLMKLQATSLIKQLRKMFTF